MEINLCCFIVSEFLFYSCLSFFLLLFFRFDGLICGKNRVQNHSDNSSDAVSSRTKAVSVYLAILVQTKSKITSKIRSAFCEKITLTQWRGKWKHHYAIPSSHHCSQHTSRMQRYSLNHEGPGRRKAKP